MNAGRIAVAQAAPWQTVPGWFEAIAQVRFRQAWSLLGLLLTPVAAAAGSLAAWRFGVEAGWTNTFFITHGFWSHWQVWCVFAISVQVCACSLSPRVRAGS